MPLADNLNPNTTGAGTVPIRFLSDGTVDWSAAVVCFAPTISPGANALQPVNAANPLPVTDAAIEAAAVAQGTVAPTKVVVIGGKSNDGTPQYREIPEGPGGRSVIVEGFVGGVAQPVSGTFWQATQPISATALPLPTGAAADSSVNGLLVAQASTTVGQSGPLIQAAVTTASPSYTNGKTSPLNLTLAGALRQDITTIAGTAPSSPGKLDVKAADGDVFVRQATGTNLHTVVDSGAITANIGTTGALALDASVNGLIVAQGATTAGENGPLIQGAVTTAAPTYVTAKTNPLSLTTGGALRSDLTTIAGTAPSTAGKIDVKGADGDVFVRQATAANLNATIVGTGTLAVQATASTTGGATPGHILSAATTNATNIKASAGTLYSVVVVNTTATIYYLKFYDVSGTPLPASDTVKWNIPVPANTSAAGVAIPIPACGIAFTTGIGLALVANISDTDNTAAATGVAVNYAFK